MFERRIGRRGSRANAERIERRVWSAAVRGRLGGLGSNARPHAQQTRLGLEREPVFIIEPDPFAALVARVEPSP